MTTSIKIEMKKVSNGIYRKLYTHHVHFLNEDGSIKSSKLDKTIAGPLFKIAKGNERSRGYGEMEWTFPGSNTPVRMVALGLDPSKQ